MDFIRKLISIILLLAFFSLPIYSQELFTWDLAYQQLDGIELNLEGLKSLNLQLENKNNELSQQVLSWESLYNLQMNESNQLLKEQKTLEKQCNFWKTSTIVCLSSSIVLTITLIIQNLIKNE